MIFLEDAPSSVGASWDLASQGHQAACCLMSNNTDAGDAVMSMAVTHLVFASTSIGDCETLHDRRKVMVSHCSARPQGQ